MKVLIASVLTAIPLMASRVCAAPVGHAPIAPPLRCELRLGSWCIAEGAAEITRTLAHDSIHDRVWELKGAFKPNSVLVVMEPSGCRVGFADSGELLRFDAQYPWRGRAWSRADVQLKADGSCNLAILFPQDDGDPMEWAFSTGLLLIRPCSAASCVGKSLYKIKSRIRDQRRPPTRKVGDDTRDTSP